MIINSWPIHPSIIHSFYMTSKFVNSQSHTHTHTHSLKALQRRLSRGASDQAKQYISLLQTTRNVVFEAHFDNIEEVYQSLFKVSVFLIFFPSFCVFFSQHCLLLAS